MKTHLCVQFMGLFEKKKKKEMLWFIGILLYFCRILKTFLNTRLSLIVTIHYKFERSVRHTAITQLYTAQYFPPWHFTTLPFLSKTQNKASIKNVLDCPRRYVLQSINSIQMWDENYTRTATTHLILSKIVRHYCTYWLCWRKFIHKNAH